MLNPNAILEVVLKAHHSIVILSICFIGLLGCTPVEHDADTSVSFILAADWRYTATEPYHSSEYFQGALEAMRSVGAGDFMLSPGDVEPIQASAARPWPASLMPSA